MSNNNRQALFEEYPIPKAVAVLSIPTILSSLVAVLYSLADTYFVGLLNDPVQTAAVTLAAPVLLAFNAVNNLFGVGSSSMMSRCLGSKDYQTLYQSSAFGFYGALISGILFSLLCTVFRTPLLALLGADAVTEAATTVYLNWTVSLGAVPAILNVVMAYMVRSEGAALHASIGTMSGCLLNILLDPLFILPMGLNMGSEGAALATFLSNCVAVIYFFCYLFFRRKSTCVRISPRLFTLRKNVVMGVCAVGIPASIQNLLNVTGTTILNNFAAPFGAAALAAMGICSKVNMVPMQIAMGLSQGIMPLVSYNYAARNPKRMKSTIFFSGRISLIFLTIVAVIFFFGSGFITTLFIQDEETVAYGARFLRGFCLALPFLGTDFLCVGIFQAVGKGKQSLILAIFRKIIFEIPLLYLFNALFPLYGLAYAQPVAEMALAAIGIYMLSKTFRQIDREQVVYDGK